MYVIGVIPVSGCIRLLLSDPAKNQAAVQARRFSSSTCACCCKGVVRCLTASVCCLNQVCKLEDKHPRHPIARLMRPLP